jgi:formylglycine-generating enzyme required for sulfatase activity
VEGAQVLIDGEPAGVTPVRDLELEAGDYELRLRADRHLERVHSLHVEGLGTHQELELTLTPAWAPVTVESTTAGTGLWVDGEPRGELPLTVDLDAGTRRIEVRAPGYKPQRREIEVVPDQPRRLAIGALEPADGTLVLTSRPSGANVAIDGRYAGRTPLSAALTPGEDHRVTLSKRGHRSATRSVSLSPEERRELEIALSAETGTVRLAVRPDDARLVVEGRTLGRAQGRHALPAYPQLLEIRREGFAAEQVWVTPRPGFEQTIEVTLQPQGAAAAASLPERITAPDGTEMILIRPGALTMGASRREPGRRANEVLHRVELTRPFYLARTEVTNARFRRFEPEHRSGRFQALDLDDPGQPVVNVTWAQAAGYCNWLNEAAGLPAIYRKGGSGLTAQEPLGPGFRLPTEAEWAWAARHAGRERASRFPWGEALPPEPGSGNFADESVSTVLADTLQGYDDGRAGTAPPGSFAAGPGGIFDLAGNVAEWVHDYYAIRPTEGGGAEPDPTGPADGRHHVIRGSSWMQASVSALRWTYRDYGSEPRPDVGFRCARYATEAPGP